MLKLVLTKSFVRITQTKGHIVYKVIQKKEDNSIVILEDEEEIYRYQDGVVKYNKYNEGIITRVFDHFHIERYLLYKKE